MLPPITTEPQVYRHLKVFVVHSVDQIGGARLTQSLRSADGQKLVHKVWSLSFCYPDLQEDRKKKKYICALYTYHTPNVQISPPQLLPSWLGWPRTDSLAVLLYVFFLLFIVCCDFGFGF